ncbi:unnamed protein product [Coffea canephora]|uniref:Cytochrome P450 CYP82D47-like n=2 Tax=Coffea TaxID=13442 RepID=A0A068V2P1_COFCA|nr:unnamed protein product [Coffea canephora]
MDLLPHLLALSGLLALFLLYKQWRPRVNPNPRSKAVSAPEAAGGWPFIGHLLQLSPNVPIARNLGAMADKYGPVFSLRLGMRQTLVVSSWEAVKECFTTNDKAFSYRPPSSFNEYVGYNYAAIGFAPYGPYWREIRKIVMLELLSNRRLERLKHVRISEIENNIKVLFDGWKSSSNDPPAKVNMGKWFEDLFLNIMVRKISGTRYTDSEVGSKRNAQFRRVVKEFVHFLGQFVVSDVIPFPLLKWIDMQGHLKSIKRVSKELDSIIQIWIDEHNERRMKISEQGDEQQDFIDALLSVTKDEYLFGHSRETVIKATLMSLVIAAFETTSIHLTWTLSLLLNNKHVMRQAQEEIDSNVGKERWAEESDINNLVYLQAIVKESIRLYPPAPLSLPRQAMEDCNVSGYRISMGTQLFVNVWKLQRDPRIWSEPDQFLPERFLNGEVDFSGKNFEFSFTPFGSGRRSCPGIPLATQVTHLTLARLLQGFDLTTPSDLPVDMTEDTSISMGKATPLEVVILPRLPNHDLYG